MITAGLDLGSRTIKLVLFDSGVRSSEVIDSGLKPLDRCRRLLGDKQYDKLVVTGYGRDLVAPELSGATISEISAQAAAVRFLYPDAASVIDIGGQDSKVIRLNEKGGVLKFEMNDRCAAGTGKFLEIMARALELTIDEFARTSLEAKRSVTLNSLCTVFAESEVVSLINKGEDAHAIALGLHQSVVTRVSGMARRVGVTGQVIFAGGGAKNACLVRLLEDKLNLKITVPDDPQITAALGAAIIAANGKNQGE
ncbi:MAG: acyl-CoA dehydratase activase [Dehalogenimonas sp.]|uniref:Acyl-CoA dehydratase activase n=1 Tax=Candidatus Dehalogenimonas loeffleri TaxID=3127115 RepID=A0ABZ2J5V7_9CHLR|nr:acyl-CoA dehydratase activase [Dehalogenimonas sp.]